MLSALELVQQPRVLDTQCFSGEVCLIDNCRLLMSESAIFDALPRAWAQQLRDALQRMERSGVMQQRRMEQGMASNRQQTADACAAAATSAAARGLRRCALPSCGAREAHVSHYKLCAACQTVVYCSKAHQAEHWAAHKAACKVARKAAAEKEEQGGASGARGVTDVVQRIARRTLLQPAWRRDEARRITLMASRSPALPLLAAAHQGCEPPRWALRAAQDTSGDDEVV